MKWNSSKPLGIVYYDGDKGKHFVKRCLLEFKNNQWEHIINEHTKSSIDIISQFDKVNFEVIYSKIKGKEKTSERFMLSDLINVKGFKAAGNRLSSYQIKRINLLSEENIQIGGASKDFIEVTTEVNNIKRNIDDESPESISIEEVDIENVNPEKEQIDDDLQKTEVKLEEESQDEGQITLDF